MPEYPPRLIAAVFIAFLGLPLTARPIEPQAHSAVYDIYMNGKLRMESRVSVMRDGDAWVLQGEGKGVKGLARFLKFRSSERGRVFWSSGTVEPLIYSHHSKVAGRDERWSAKFDWASGTVATVHEDGTSSLEAPAGTVDPASLGLVLREYLDQGRDEWRVHVVDEDEIDEHRYAVGGAESLQTGIGCFGVVRLQRVRENSKRYSRAWYAPDLHWIPLRLQHGKEGDSDFDLRIRQLEIGGQPVTGPAQCP